MVMLFMVLYVIMVIDGKRYGGIQYSMLWMVNILPVLITLRIFMRVWGRSFKRQSCY